MENFITQLSVLLVLVVIAAVMLCVLGVLPGPAGRKEKEEISDSDTKRNCHLNDIFDLKLNMNVKPQHTAVLNTWRLEVLAKDGTVLESFPFSSVPACGLSIGRGDCNIRIKCSPYISDVHAHIGKDQDGLFLKDNNSTNHIYDEQKRQADQISLDDGTIFFLANVKFCLRRVDPFSASSDERQSAGFVEDDELKQIIRRL